jgi:shikimate dehydrogenase
MMEKAFARAGLDWRYLSCEVAPEALADAVRGIRALGFRGANVTRPHKVAIVPWVDRLTSAAEMMGAVNCLINDDGQLLGENTDGKGFLAALRTLADPAGQQVVVLGAGGAARAVSVELALAGAARITIVNRTAERGQQLADMIFQRTGVESSAVVWSGEYAPPSETQILVNATSIGLNDPDTQVPVELGALPRETIAADVVFNPADTQFLCAARQHGCRTLDGLGMIVHQGAIAFRLWTGIESDTVVMREAVEEYLSL